MSANPARRTLLAIAAVFGLALVAPATSAAGTSFAGASSDGSKVFVRTGEQLVSGDTDGDTDIYERSGGTTTWVSRGQINGNGAFSADFEGASSDGSKVFFATYERLVSGDTDSQHDVYERSGGTTTQVSQGQINGNGASFYVDFIGASSDGSKVFFATYERLVSGDTDSHYDLYERSGGTTTQVSQGQINGNGNFHVETFQFDPGLDFSSDGSKVFFATQEQLVSGDTDSSTDVYERSGGTTTQVSQGQINGNGGFDVYFEGTSSDGSKVFFWTDEQLVSGDTDSEYDIYERSGGSTTQVSEGAINGDGAFAAFFRGASSDGSKVFFETDEQLVSGDTDFLHDIYERSGGTTTRVSQGQMNGNGAFGAGFQGISSDGSKVFFATAERLVSGDTDSGEDLYERSGGTTTWVSQGQINGNLGHEVYFIRASSDGLKVFFLTYEPLVSGDTDGNFDLYERSGGTTTQVSQGQINGNGDGLVNEVQFSGASSDGSKVFFNTAERLVSGDINGDRDVYERSAGTTKLVAVDTSPPNTTISGGPSGATNDPTPTFTFSSTDPGATFQCKLDAGAYAPCSSPRTVAHLNDGSHTFYVRARDPSGNLDATPATRTFTVQTAEVKKSGSTLVVTAAAGAKDNILITKPSASALRVTDSPAAPTRAPASAWARAAPEAATTPPTARPRASPWSRSSPAIRSTG